MLGTLILALGVALEVIPAVRDAWRWLLERELEVGLREFEWQDGEKDELKFRVNIEEPEPGGPPWRPHFYVLFTLRIVNHRTDRLERVIGARLVIKKRRLFFWRKDIAEVQVLHVGDGQLHGPPIADLPIEALSAPVEVRCIVDETLDEDIRQRLPTLSEIWLVFDLVGPLRRWERNVQMLFRRGRTVRPWHRVGF